MSQKTVLLTGGTGSFGKGFTRMLLDDPKVKMIRIFSRDEHKHREMRQAFPSDRVSFYIGDVRDRDRLERVMRGCNWVVHAAALKQAPLGEIEPQEFIKTNIQGSINVAEAALSAGVDKVILISTDKAVEPVNLYGATKMCAERVFLQMDVMRGAAHTRFAIVRYGNVAGTAGSIVPVLKALPENAATPIHDPEATRFWLDLAEANRFVLESIRGMKGGEVFIPPMQSVRVVDVAEAIRPGRPLRISGPRSGDKRHEVISLEPRISSDGGSFMSVAEITRRLEDAR